MTFEEALVFVDSVLKPGYLNQVQELVLRQSWEGRTYLEIAIDSCYDAEYIKNVGYHLWHLLSQRLGEKVTKSNFRSVLRRHSSHRAALLSATLTPDNQVNPIAPLFFALPNLEPQESRESSSIIVESQNQDYPVLSGQEKVGAQQTQKLSKAISTPKIPTTDKWRLATQKEWEKERAQERENKGHSQNTQSMHGTVTGASIPDSSETATEYGNTLALSSDLPCGEPFTSSIINPSEASHFSFSSEATVNSHTCWEKAIDVSFYGRAAELATLEQWIVEERCRLVALLGMGGIGKTALSVKLAEQISHEFEYVVWRALQNAPPVTQMLTALLQSLSNQHQKVEPTTVEAQIEVLMEYLRKHRCFLVLDGVEAILRSGAEPLQYARDSNPKFAGRNWRLYPLGNRNFYGERGTLAGCYGEGYEAYGELFRRLGEERHQSCIVLTSREQPKELAFLVGQKVRLLHLSGLSEEAAQEIFKEKGCFGQLEPKWKEVTQLYQGNPLALRLVSTTIQELFDCNATESLSKNIAFLGDIRDWLNQHIERLSYLEKEILCWLAVCPNTVSIREVLETIKISSSTLELLEALESLKRRGLTEIKQGVIIQKAFIKEYIKYLLLEHYYHQKIFSVDLHKDSQNLIQRLLHNENSILEI
jgi:hypothetical protein